MLFKEDMEAPRLQHLPGVEEMLQQLVQYQLSPGIIITQQVPRETSRNM